MFCRKCGKQIPDNSAFCSNCGSSLADQPAAAPSAPVIQPAPAASPFVPESTPVYTPQPSQAFGTAAKQARKNTPALIFAVISVVLAVVLVLTFVGILPFTAAASSAAFASQSFATPEAAIESFVGYLKSGDYDGALGTCAINNMASRFDYVKFCERLLVLTPITTTNMPSQYAQYVKFNAYKSAAAIMTQMIGFTISFGLSEENKGLIEGEITQLADGQFPDGLLEELNPDVLDSLEIVKIAKTSLHDSIKNRENQQKQADVYGADDVQFRSVLYTYNGSYYVGGFTLIQHDGGWQIQNMTDPIIGIPAYGTPIPVADESEFDSMLGY